MKANNRFLLSSIVLPWILLFGIAKAFAPIATTSTKESKKTLGRFQGQAFISHKNPTIMIRKQGKILGTTTTSTSLELFGLGGAEIAIILVAAAFLLGPQKLAELGRDAGKIAGELKEVPKEFQKGLAEGEIQAKNIKKELSESATTATTTSTASDKE